MAPFAVATEMTLASSPADDVQVYRGNADSEWTIHLVPHGGYLLALILNACMQHQAASHNPDPIHVTAHFLRATVVGPLEVHIRTVRTGKALSNFSAELIQDGAVNITTHLVFGVLDASTLPPPEMPFNLHPPAPHARITPLTTHPSACPPRQFLFFQHFSGYLDNYVDEALGVLPNPSGGIAIGEWLAMRDPADKQLTLPSLAFFSDIFPALLPSVVAELGPSWFPTVVLSLEFKAPIPRGTNSVGAYVTSRFIADPQGRHDVYCELWTAPQGEDDGGNWREKQRCLLVSHQTALVMSMAMNEKKGKGKSRL